MFPLPLLSTNLHVFLELKLIQLGMWQFVCLSCTFPAVRRGQMNMFTPPLPAPLRSASFFDGLRWMEGSDGDYSEV